MPDTNKAAVEWNAVATAWDTHVDYVDEHSVALTEALLDRVAVQPGERVLELAAGPGSLGEDWSRLVGASGSVVLSDIAEGMVEVARSRNASLDNVDFAVIDATSIDRPDGCFESTDIETHVARVTSLAGPLAASLENASADQRAALENTAVELAAPYASDSGFAIPGRALLVSARR